MRFASNQPPVENRVPVVHRRSGGGVGGETPHFSFFPMFTDGCDCRLTFSFFFGRDNKASVIRGPEDTPCVLLVPGPTPVVELVVVSGTDDSGGILRNDTRALEDISTRIMACVINNKFSAAIIIISRFRWDGRISSRWCSMSVVRIENYFCTRQLVDYQ